jgi:phosphoglycerate dehydrogenase-like enzyme
MWWPDEAGRRPPTGKKRLEGRQTRRTMQRPLIPLLKMDNAICTPHLGYVERDSYESYYDDAVEQIVAYAEGMPINVVNPEAPEKK